MHKIEPSKNELVANDPRHWIRKSPAKQPRGMISSDCVTEEHSNTREDRIGNILLIYLEISKQWTSCKKKSVCNEANLQVARNKSRLAQGRHPYSSLSCSLSLFTFQAVQYLSITPVSRRETTMPSILSTATSLLPYHLLSYGALLGTELYQSFINTKICFRALPMREFLILQKRLFPTYFRCQLGLAALTALTRPPHGPASFAGYVGDAVPLVVVAVTGALNHWIFGPRTTRDAFVRRAVLGRFLFTDLQCGCG